MNARMRSANVLKANVLGGFLIREWHDAKVAFVFKHRNKDLLWALA